MNYVAAYDSLISKAVKRGRLDCYCELHHIIPKSLGGKNAPENLVFLTAKEHYVAHKLLWKIHKNRQMARAFTLLARTSERSNGKEYEKAKTCYAKSMTGENNVAKRPEVREKISKNHSPNFLGKKRPEHAALLKKRRVWSKEKNPFYGLGSRQAGHLNHMARPLSGEHSVHGKMYWATQKEAADYIGVTIQAIHQAIRRQGKSKGWKFEGMSC